MTQHLQLAAAVIAATSSHHFHIGPWIIVPILALAAIVAIPVYILRDRRKRLR